MKILTAAYQGAEKMMNKVLGQLNEDDTATDDDMMRVYEGIRGNPQAIAMYTIDNAPKGSSPMVESRKYEQAMEKKWSARHGQRGGNNGS